MINSAYFSFVRKKSATLFVVFSHVDIVAGKFSQYSTFIDMNFDIIFLNCPQNSYYLNGIPGLGENLTSTLRTLSQICSKNGYDRIICFGNSMGAFGAMLYGLEIGSDILALGPEFLLGVPGGACNTKIADKSLRSIGRERLAMACKLYSNPSSKILALFGEMDFSDLICAASMRRYLNTRVITLADAPHSIAPYLEANIGLESFILSFIFDDNHNALNPFKGAILEHRNLIRLGFDTYVRRRARHISDNVTAMIPDYDVAAHIAVQQERLAGKKPKFVKMCNPESKNLLLHLACFDADGELWRQIVSPETIQSVISRYLRNASWGEMHRFLSYVIKYQLMGKTDIIQLGISEDIVKRIEFLLQQRSP
jgi:hypothetical protein